MPKTCTCCNRPITTAEWASLPLLGYQRDAEDPAYDLELRNCNGTRSNGQPCGSTLAHPVAL